MNISRRNVLRISGATAVGISVGQLAFAVGSEAEINRPNVRGMTTANGRYDTLSRHAR